MFANHHHHLVACILVLFLSLWARSAFAEQIQERSMRVGEQISIPAQGVAKYSEGKRGVVDVRLPEDGTEFIVVGLQEGESTLLLIDEEGEKTSYRLVVEPLLAEVEARENIRLDFYFVELSTSGGYQLGLDWPSTIGSDQNTLDLRLGSGGLQSASANLSGLPLPRLDALQRGEWARISRQASIITANGERATFQSGGEVNVAIQGSNAAELRKIPFGTELQVLPRYDAKSGRLELRIEADISALGEGEVPSRNRSVVSTVVNVEIDQGIVLAGLRAKSRRQSRRGLPLLSQIPVVGALFGSHGAAHEEVQNAIFIVPSVINVVDLRSRERIQQALELYEDFSGDLQDANFLGDAR